MPYATIFFTGNGHKSQGSLTLNWNDGGTFDTVYNVLACGDVFWATLYKRENFAIYTIKEGEIPWHVKQLLPRQHWGLEFTSVQRLHLVVHI